MSKKEKKIIMSSLRKELEAKKIKDQKIIDEAAECWVANNIILIHEKIDRRTIKSLTDKIVKFDQMFGAFKDKLPSIAAQIDQAEDGLQKVITGRVNDKKAMNLLKQLGFLYNNFSTFFTSDLPVILETPLLKAAKENPEVKLSVLQHPRYQPNIVRDAFKNALEPSIEEQRLLRKIYRGTQPLINSTAIANEMLNLSFNELKELTNIGKVPMIDFPQGEEGIVQQQALQEERNFFLTEKIDVKKMEQIADLITQINSKLHVHGLEDVQKSVRALATKARREITDGRWNVPGRPSAAKQLIMFYNVLEKMGEAWPSIKGTFLQDGELDAEELADIKNTLTKTAQDTLFKRLTRILGTQHYPGLDPESVATSISNALGDEANINDVEQFFNATKVLPKASSKGEPVAGSIKTEPGKLVQPGKPPKEPIGSDKTTTQGSEVPVDKMTKVAKALRDQGLEIDDRDEVAIQNIIDLFDQAGLKISNS